jgi:hypothetical protein
LIGNVDWTALRTGTDPALNSFALLRHRVRKPILLAISARLTNCSAPALRRLIEGIRGRGNIGRWRRAGAAKVVELGRGAQADPEHFGYEV